MNNSNGRGCSIFLLLLIPIGYFIYIFLSPEDPEFQKINDEIQKRHIDYISRFTFNVDSLARNIFLIGSYNNNITLNKKYLIFDENENGEKSFNSALTSQLPDSLVAFNINELQTLIISKYIKGEQYFKEGFEVSIDNVELSFVYLKTFEILKTDYVVGGHQIVSQSNRSHTKTSEVNGSDILNAILKDITE